MQSFPSLYGLVFAYIVFVTCRQGVVNILSFTQIVVVLSILHLNVFYYRDVIND